MTKMIEFVLEVGVCAVIALAYPVIYTRREDRKRDKLVD